MPTATLGSRGALALVLVLVSSPAAAQEQAEETPSNADAAMQNGGMTQERDLADEQARAHFRAARSLYDLGRFRQAAEAFEEAYRLSQRPELLFNAYVAYREANDLAGAVRSLGAYLDLVQDAPDRANLQARLASMSEALERDREREAALQAMATARSAPPVPRGGEVWPWVVMGLGVAAMAGGIVTGSFALTESDALVAACPNDLCGPSVDLDQRRSTVETLAITTDVLLFAGGGVALLGLVLGLVLNAGESPTSTDVPAATEVTTSCGPTGCAAVLRTRF